jgi:hypothetical protein
MHNINRGGYCMEADKLAKQMIDFHKTAFNNTFDIVMAVQDQSEKITRSWCEKSGILPDQSKKMIHDWGNVIKKSLGEYKKVVNHGFDTIETCFDFSKTFSQIKPSSVAEMVMANKPQEEKAAPLDEQQ